MDRAFERIELGGELWWEVYTEITRGMRKAFNHATITAMGRGLAIHGDIDFTDIVQVKKAALSSPETFNLDAIDDAYLLHGTKAYSYGDQVTIEMIDNLSDEIVQRVLPRMRTLYAAITEEEAKKDTAPS